MLYFFLPLLATLPFNIQEGVGPRLDFRNNEFVISRAGKTERFPVQVPEAATLFWPPEPLLFRRDDAYVVWDVRGLTIRQKTGFIIHGFRAFRRPPSFFHAKKFWKRSPF